MRDWILAVPFVLLLPIALLQTETIAAFAPLSCLMAGMGRIFPFINEYAGLSLFPQVTQLTLATAMALSAILLPAFLYYQLKIQDFRKMNGSTGMKYWGWAAGCFALVPFYMSGPVAGQSVRSLSIDLLICQSRLALGIFAALLTQFEIIFLAVPVVWLKSKSSKQV